jgi:cyanophycinase-like exopeptidase
VRQHLDFGEDVRHVEKYDGVFFLIGDKTQSISSIHVNTEDLSVDDTIVAFWSRDPTYAGYLLSNFEQAWAQGV